MRKENWLFFIAFLLCLSVSMQPLYVQASTSFKDVPAAHKSKINLLVDKKIITGYKDGTFRPNENVNRGQFALFISRALDLPKPSNPKFFKDVGEDSAVFDGINKAQAAGIIQGYADGRFKPGETITRGDMAIMLDRALQYKGNYKETSTLTYADKNLFGATSSKAISRLTHYGIMGSHADNKFAPKAYGNRLQTVLSIYQLLGIKGIIEVELDLSRGKAVYPELVKTSTNKAPVTDLTTGGDYRYENAFSISKRYLFKDANGKINLLEVEDGTIHVQQYTSGFSKVSQQKVKMELSQFGGFHYGEDGNHYIIFGQDNYEESNSKIVYRIVKYDSSWKKLSQVDISDVYVTRPFHGSNLTMDSHDGKLAVHTARERYRNTKDGLRHQSNISFLINMKDMKVLYKAGQWPNNHVSYSFATYVKFDGDKIVYADHGDGAPRSFVLQVTEDNFVTKKEELIKFQGESGENYTGGYLGGLEVSKDNYLVTGSNSVQYRDNTQNVFLSVIPKRKESKPKTVWLTNHKSNTNVSIIETHLSKINDNKFVVLWKEINRGDILLYYVVVDGSGNMLKKPKALLDVPNIGHMQPLVVGDTITWYSNGYYSNTLDFYTLIVE
ncbi:S-layer homology domain-containing protein [Sporosarcina highlanderae]|uniref:S-layer homology domain-containing protein n=1 Tax=Sporosarcina highlanderae TaxID=3035916 RepID=A0ABT8JNB5_9BACL|nr:S-layer homology domain-containing protein [Sporosarcina highlanderae]MDN4605867.1 S-layer homology domain-containing protein [Sporosarcina highlanderae]